MKTLEKYVFGSFLSSFVLAFLVLSFVLTIGLMVQIVGFILDGVSMSLIGEFALVCLPETLQWTMPLALLVSSILVFSRLSADSEIAAMRSCGVNILSVVKWPILFAVMCTFIGFFVNNEIVPRGHEVRRTLKTKVSVGTGLDVLEPGRIIDEFPNVKVYFGAKEGNWVYDLIVLDYSDPDFDRQISAAKALVTSEGQDIILDLYQMTVDPVDAKHQTMARMSRCQYRVKNALSNKKYTKRDKDLTFFEALDKIKELREQVHKAAGASRAKGTERNLLRCRLSSLKTEFAKRFVFALASICFVLIGIPLGIKAQRKESTIGMAISLAISLGYYMIVILMLSLEEAFVLHPHYIIFLPVLVCFALAARLLPKNM